MLLLHDVATLTAREPGSSGPSVDLENGAQSARVRALRADERAAAPGAARVLLRPGGQAGRPPPVLREQGQLSCARDRAGTRFTGRLEPGSSARALTGPLGVERGAAFPLAGAAHARGTERR